MPRRKHNGTPVMMWPERRLFYAISHIPIIKPVLQQPIDVSGVSWEHQAYNEGQAMLMAYRAAIGPQLERANTFYGVDVINTSPQGRALIMRQYKQDLLDMLWPT